jgi:GNAT superfamily N-acetyltransferase
VILGPAGREEFLALMRETYARAAMSEAEFDWWFDCNPEPPRVVSAARDEDGRPLGVLAMSPVRTDACLAACSVHGVTTPHARGRGVFTALELHNEAAAAEAGVDWVFAFTNPRTGPIFVGPLGWAGVAPLRLWARPRRLRRTGAGGFREEPSCPAFEPRHEVRFREHHIRREPKYLTWRYADSPRRYHRVERDDGWAVVGFAHWHGFSVAVICEAVGMGLAQLVRACVEAVDSDLALAMVNPGDERAYLAAGFLPTPRSIPFVAKRLREEAPPLPRERSAWRFSLGDMDWF